MENVALRLMFIHQFNLRQLEAYMSKMSKQGLHITKLGYVSLFTKGQPKNLVYRIEPMIQKCSEGPMLTAEQCSCYEHDGWNYVCLYLGMFLIYSKEMTDSIELPKRKIEAWDLTKSYTYGQLRRQQMRVPVLYVVLFFFSLFQIITDGPFVFKTTTYEIIRTNTVFLVAYFVLCFLAGIVVWKKSRAYIHRIEEEYESGYETPISFKPVNGRNQAISVQKSWKSSIFKICSMIVVTVLVLFAILIKCCDHDLTTHSLYDYQGTLPCVDLRDFEVSEVELDDSQTDRDLFGLNQYKTQESFLVPVQLEINETGTSPYGNEYSASMDTIYYELRFQYLTNTFFRQMLSEKLEKDIKTRFTIYTIKDTKTERLYYIQTDGKQFLAGYYGKKVIFITYVGGEQLRNAVEEVEEILKRE